MRCIGNMNKLTTKDIQHIMDVVSARAIKPYKGYIGLKNGAVFQIDTEEQYQQLKSNNRVLGLE